MDVILVKDIKNKGKMGDKLTVKRGYAMNFLIPQGIAISATTASSDKFEALRKKELERLESLKGSANELKKQLDGKEITLSAKSQNDKLYGSIPPNTISKQIKTELNIDVNKDVVTLESPIKTIGDHKVKLELHPDVDCTITVHVVSEVEDDLEDILNEEEETDTDDIQTEEASTDTNDAVEETATVEDETES